MNKVAGIIIFVFLFFVYFAFPALPIMAAVTSTSTASPAAGAALEATTPAGAQEAGGAGQDAAGSYGGVKSISPSAFVAKINKLIAMIGSSIDGIAVPLASTMLAICAVVFIVGLFTGMHFVKRVGFWGTFMVGLGLLLLYGRPLFLGLIQALISFINA